jgi:archaellum biogenesis ATPase FlaH
VQKLLASRIRAAEQLKDPAHVRIATLGIFRITMQHGCVTLGEWIVRTLRKSPSLVSSYTSVDVATFSQPADGALVSLLSQLLVAAENIGWRSAGKQFWQQVDLPDELRQLTNTTRANLETILTAFVRARNDGAEGHGLPGGYTPATDVAVVKALIGSLVGILPVASKDDGVLYLPSVGGLSLGELTTLKTFDGNPICYRKLKRTSAGRIQIEAQIQKTLLTRDDVTYEVENVLLDLPRAASPEYDIAELAWNDGWKPFVYIPARLASPEVFTGRIEEMRALVEWADDSDSRKCMVWGDGGVGKTTLVVEFLHRLLDGTAEVEWRPELITFYTAKKTRWGLKGLEQISAQDVGVADVALDVARMLTTPNLDRSWFEKSPRDVIQKLAGILADMKISRDDHLIVLDNTETMTRSDADVHALAMQINELSRRVGRVILTSRRRELIEALPIQTENWSEDEGADFLKKRGDVLRCTSIRQAGLSTLKKYSRLLINKPIALEVFVQAASKPDTSLDSAFQRVQRMQRQDLGQFLYDDAWARLSSGLRRVLLLMSRLGDSHDQYLLQLCCQREDVTVAAASEAIEESKGIASMARFEGNIQITFSAEFYNYCIERWEQVDGRRAPADEDIEWVRRRYAEFLSSASAQVHDRNVRAFRVPAARAAWKSFVEKRVDDSLRYYEIAVLEDVDNGWLFDRYAYTLMKLKKLAFALDNSKKAVFLLPDDPEARFTKGMIEGRIGNVSEAVGDLDMAASLGKPRHLCELQKAYAYVYSSPPDLVEARVCLDRANRSAPKDKFLSRFVDEATRFERRWMSARNS